MRWPNALRLPVDVLAVLSVTIAGSFDDFGSEWYRSVGVSLVFALTLSFIQSRLEHASEYLW